MFSNDEWDFFLSNWKEQYGQTYTGRHGTRMVVPVNSDLRREMYKYLIATLVEKGMTMQDMIRATTKMKVVEASVNPEHENGGKLKKWRRICELDYLSVLSSLYPEAFVSKSTETIRKSEQGPVQESQTEEVKEWETYTQDDEVIELKKPVDRSRFPKTNLPPIPSDEEIRAELMRELEESEK